MDTEALKPATPLKRLRRENPFIHKMRIKRLYRPFTHIVNVESGNDCVIDEERVSFYLNGQKLLSVMSLPQEQDAHIVGFLLSEGVLDSVSQIKSLQIANDGLSVSIQADINESKLQHLHKEKTLTSGCCVGVSGNFDGEIIEKFIATPMKVSIECIFALLDKFNEPSALFLQTGCTHKAMLVCGRKILISEDVGRHNAIDKVIGKARLGGIDIKESILIVSGRLSMEMVIKAAMNDVPMVISRAATTKLGIKSAQILGITLMGFARGKSLNIYTHPSRVVE